MSDQLDHDLAVLIFEPFDQSGMNQKMEDGAFKIFIGPGHANAARTAQRLRADQARMCRQPSENVRYIMTLATSTDGQVPLTSYLSRLKRRHINYGRVVTGPENKTH